MKDRVIYLDLKRHRKAERASNMMDLVGITATIDSILFRHKDGGVTRVDLTGLHNAREVSDEIVSRAISKGIGVRAAVRNDCALPAS